VAKSKKENSFYWNAPLILSAIATSSSGETSILGAALHRNIPIFEYAPKKIKLAITGTGLASKEQMATILQRFFDLKEFPQNHDETDAIAIAMCHFFQRNALKTKKNTSSWADFVKKNPDRVK
jgi:crossover junction endodeoxyribonuclease RuvC